jgi:DNA processing protein
VSQHNQLSLFDDSDRTDSSSGSKQITEEDKISLLALSEVQGVGFATIRALYEACNGRLSQVWVTDDDKLSSYLHQASIPQYKQVIHQIKARSKEVYQIAKERYFFLKRREVEIIFRGTDAYPKSLYDLKLPPLWLFVEGNANILHSSSIVAVIGTREPTEGGLRAAKWLSVLLITRGYTILSGLAEGIDEAGHQAAVDYRTPTIAVLGHGIDVVFPVSTSNLRRLIVERGGAVVSEYLPKDMYNRERFVQRNRIQAALAGVVAVVEGKAKSGTAHTIRFARELHRPLFGVRIGPMQALPQQEVLQELIRHENFVFDLDNLDDCNKLSSFLPQVPSEQPKSVRTPHLFGGLVEELERLSRDYNARESDFDWLLGQIRLYRDNVERVRSDDHQSSHS